MAESIKRLSGPEQLSGSTSSPTTIFTVPPKKIYVIRDLTMVAKPTVGAASTSRPSVLLGLTNLTPSKTFFGQTLESVAGGYTTETASMAIPFTENEVVVGAATGLSDVTTYNWGTTAVVFDISSSTDTTTYSSVSDVPPAGASAPANVYFLTINTKATTPDTITSITDNHGAGRVSSIANITSVATSTIRGSIWGGYQSAKPTGAATYTVVFGGTQTSCLALGLSFTGSSYNIGTPSTSDVVLQTATNSGTTETAQSVTMTPTTGNTGFQVLLVGTVGVASIYTAGTGGTAYAQDGEVTPSSTVAAVIFDPPVTNPSATISVAGTSWVAACIEVAHGGYPLTLTTSGVIIEP